MAVRNPAYGQPDELPILAKILTKDHKPDDPMEKEAIEELVTILCCQILLIPTRVTTPITQNLALQVLVQPLSTLLYK